MPQALAQPVSPAKPPAAWPKALPEQSALQDVLHEPHHEFRDRLLHALIGSGLKSHARWAKRIAECGHTLRFYIDPDTGRVSTYLFRCKSRLCPFCSRQRTAHVADQMALVVNRFTDPRTIVLTVKSLDTPLRDQLRSLRRSFAKLRRTQMWRTSVSGGVYTLEVTLNVPTGLWHPHLHIIYDGSFIPQKMLQAQWHKASGGAQVVWISKVYDARGAVAELTKYIGKPPSAATWSNINLCEYATATTGTRMVQTFGNCHGLKIEDREPPEPDGPDTWSVSIARLVYLAAAGDPTAQRLLDLIAKRWPYLANYIYHALPQLTPPELQAHKSARLLALLEGRPPPVLRASSSETELEALDTHILAHFTRFHHEDERRDQSCW